MWYVCCFFKYTATTEIYTDGHTRSLPDALPICVHDQVPALAVDARDAAFVVGGDLHQHVAGEELALGTALLAGAHLHHFLGRHQHVAEARFHAGTHDAVAQRLGHGLLEPRVEVHDIPTLVDFGTAVVFRHVFLTFLTPMNSYLQDGRLIDY